MSNVDLKSPKLYSNRELSWLEFNRRVLVEAERKELPLMERLKFLAIVSSNFDEFFMVRFALVLRERDNKRKFLGPDRAVPEKLITEITSRAHSIVDRQYKTLYKDVLPAMEKEGISLVRPEKYTEEDRRHLRIFFDEEILPALTPMAIDPAHPFPLLTSCSIYLLFKVSPQESTEHVAFAHTDTVLVQVPPAMERYVALPAGADKQRFALLEDVIATNAEGMHPGYDIDEVHPFRVTRDAEFTVDDEQSEDLLTDIEQELKSRRRGAPVRLEIGKQVPAKLKDYLLERLELNKAKLFELPGILDLKSLFGLAGKARRSDLEITPWPPSTHPLFRNCEDVFSVIRENDILMHHPYHSFDPVVRLVTQAANDPQVLAIKMTLYRVSGDSPIVKALARAAEAGKQVTVILELRARFDEEANIQWARRLDSAGAHVIYGVVGYKTHSKALLVVRKEEDGIRRYAHLSTGNYNDKTARMYTDMGLFTSRADIGADISAFFNTITGYSLPGKWNRIEIAPTGLRQKFLYLIRREIELHTKETPGLIRAKLNSLIDPGIIEALYEASRAGVKIQLMVRGMCLLKPGIKGLSENISVVSVIDRYLEHSRIYHFQNGGNREVYLSSADWMERNLDRRVELMFPLLEDELQEQALHVIDVAFKDNTNAWILDGDTYSRPKQKKSKKLFRSQEALYLEIRKEAEQKKSKSRIMFRVRDTED